MKKVTVLFLIVILASPLFSPRIVLAQKEKKPFSTPEDTTLKVKSPMGALLRSIAFPGWGQFYNQKYLKALVAFGFESTYIAFAIDEWIKAKRSKKNFKDAQSYADSLYQFDLYQYHRDQRNLYLWVVSGIIFLSMFDAYVDAHLYNFDKIKMRDLEVGLALKPHEKRINFLVNFNF